MLGIEILGWAGRARRERARAQAIAAAYLDWLADAHPHVFDAHRVALLALREVASEAELAPRIARLDRLVRS